MADSEDLCIGLVRLLPHSAPAPTEQNHETSNRKTQPALPLITCTTFSTPLSSAPPYTALSYAWGDPSIVTPILNFDAPVFVPINLEAALQHIASTIFKPLTIWIDALCINQEDEREKTEQVGRMRDIYSRAEEVVAWLGRSEEPDGTRRALRWIELWGMKAVELGIGATPEMMLRKVLVRSESGADEGDSKEVRAFTRGLKEELSGQAGRQEFEALVAALQNFLDRPYWTRLWVVQEVQMAAKVTFVCPEGVVGPEAVNAALRLLRNFRHWQLMKRGREVQSGDVDSAQQQEILQTNPSQALNLLKVTRTGRYQMVSLLRITRGCKATDPRDRIFAVLGISIHAESLGLRPDYSLTCEQVYTHLARKLLQGGHFEMLEDCNYMVKREDATKLRLQSWVPDWTLPLTREGLQSFGYPAPQGESEPLLQPAFRASGGRGAEEIGGTPSWDDPLVLSAIAIGRVALVGDPWKQGDVGHWLQTVQDCAQAAECRHSDPAVKSSAVWRTAVADKEARNGRYTTRLPDEVVARLGASFSGRSFASLRAQEFADNGLGQYAERSNQVGRSRRPFLLSSGHLGVGPKELDVGDDVFVLLGAAVPYVLRSRAEDNFVVIGSAYVHGCMDGEAAGDDSVAQTIEIH